MVKVVGYSQRENKEGNAFISLELEGDLVMVQSAETGSFYATAKKCSISSTFDEEKAMSLIGREIPGRVEKVDCEEYEYTIHETGEVLLLSHRYEFVPEGQPTPLRVVTSKVAA
jgi:hypothetical protein